MRLDECFTRRNEWAAVRQVHSTDARRTNYIRDLRLDLATATAKEVLSSEM
jgi:hypothetical protein